MRFIKSIAQTNVLKRFTSQALFGSAVEVISTTPGRVFRLDIINTGVSSYEILLIDKATASAASDRGIAQFRANGGTSLALDFTGFGGIAFANGIMVGLSTITNPPTLTLPVVDVALLTAWYTAQ
jgi:hypothetical protein